ncbi:MAG: NigD-like N-terminal domain-containing protein [Prevotella sp.]|nr:NigD-like N-terminal domain-containing protein [Prevotella sp.]
MKRRIQMHVRFLSYAERALRGRIVAAAVGGWLGTMLLVGCTTENYESGDGPYSYLRADFTEIHTVASGEMDYAVTDDNDTVMLQPHAQASWATAVDSIYRALLYHNKSGETSTPVTVTQVPVMNWVPTGRVDTLQCDSLTLESSWISANGKYLNLALVVKTGNADGTDAKQTVGLAQDTSRTTGSAAAALRLVLTHRQNGVPQYYSAKSYVSIPLNTLPENTPIILTVQTYNGKKVVTFP